MKTLYLCLLMLFHSSALFADTQVWTAKNQQAINAFLKQSNSNGIAVFDADGTLWKNDIGEAFLRWLITQQKLITVDYQKDIYAEYENRVAQNTKAGYSWAVSLMAGLNEEDIKTWASEFFKTQFSHQIYEPQKKLIASLKDKGIPVWIVSASNRWIIEAAAFHFGVAPSNVIGISLEVKDGILTNKIQQPVPYGPGKLAALLQQTKAPILYASGDSMGDQFLLENATTMCTLIVNPNKNNEEILKIAHKNNCNIQLW